MRIDARHLFSPARSHTSSYWVQSLVSSCALSDGGEFREGCETNIPSTERAIHIASTANVTIRNRSTLWLNIHALYRVHNQTVTLLFDEGMQSMCGDDDVLLRTAERLIEIARRILRLATEVAEEEIAPGEVAAQAYAEAERLRELADILKD
jgi:hypothetical protein